MPERITDQHLNALCMRLNRATGGPLTYTDNAPGQPFSAAIGHFHIDHAYGQTRLVRVTNTSGGAHGYGYLAPKRITADRISAMLDALTDTPSVETLRADAAVDRARIDAQRRNDDDARRAARSTPAL